LQGGARKKGNSEFIDENFQSHSDQWAYLASIGKIAPEEIKKWLSELCEGNGLGELSNTEIDNDDSHKPWETKKPEIELEHQDFPDKLTVVEANRLYIPKKNVSQLALNRIKRLAAFSNPLFYKTQKMRMSTFGIAERKCNTLILVHLQTLFDQWKKSLEQFLEIDETLPEPQKRRGRKTIRSIIGQTGSGKNTSSGIIDIALVQSLIWIFLRNGLEFFFASVICCRRFIHR
jgi:hypothetical protein